MPRPIEALARRYQHDALRIATISEGRGHGDIAYQAVTVSPPEVENAVVNLLRFHEAETAILFCATREKVRHLHATLQERGFAVVALSGEHSQGERNQALQALRDGRARVCVATDVAARGIDLPTLSLVVHVEIPRDAETLQHRSGRTGRAGRKGIAVLIVPFSGRRRVEAMLNRAKIAAEWQDVPDREAIGKRDRERLLAKLLAPVEVEDADRDLAQRLLAERSPDEIAAMLVHAHRASLPEPEDLIANTPPGARRRAERSSSPRVRGHGVVPHGCRSQQQCRPALAAADHLPPRAHYPQRNRPRSGSVRRKPTSRFRAPSPRNSPPPPRGQAHPMARKKRW